MGLRKVKKKKKRKESKLKRMALEYSLYWPEHDFG